MQAWTLVSPEGKAVANATIATDAATFNDSPCTVKDATKVVLGWPRLAEYGYTVESAIVPANLAERQRIIDVGLDPERIDFARWLVDTGKLTDYAE